MITGTAKTCGKVKDRCEIISDEMNSVKTDIEEMNSAIAVIKGDIETGKAFQNGVKVKDAKKSGFKDSYELIYGPIKAPGKNDDPNKQ